MNKAFAIGMSKVKENDFISAIEYFTISIQETPENTEAYAERAVAYLNSNQFELSMFDMNKCIEMEPNNSYRYSCRAFLKTKMGDTNGAIADYEIAVRLDPEDAIAYNNLGLVQESKGFMKQAQKSFDESNRIIGYSPKKFDEHNLQVDEPNKKETEQHEINNTTGKSVLKSVFTSKKGFNEFVSFVKNGFKLKK